MTIATVLALQDARVQTLLRRPYQPMKKAANLRKRSICEKPSHSAYAMGCRCVCCREIHKSYRARRRALGLE